MSIIIAIVTTLWDLGKQPVPRVEEDPDDVGYWVGRKHVTLLAAPPPRCPDVVPRWMTDGTT